MVSNSVIYFLCHIASAIEKLIPFDESLFSMGPDDDEVQKTNYEKGMKNMYCCYSNT